MSARATTTRISKQAALRAVVRAGLTTALLAASAKAQTFSAPPVVFVQTGSNLGLAQQVNITLTAPSTIRSIAIPVPLAAQPEFVLDDNGGCVEDGTTVNATGTVCSLIVRFHPALPGLRTGSLLITDGSGNATAIGLSGVGSYPQIAITPAPARIVAGLGPMHAGYTGDGDAAISAQLNLPRGIAADSFGNIFIIDNDTASSSVVRMLDAFGNITTVAGGGSLSGAAASGSLATSAKFALISHLACDSAGNLYVSDSTNNVVWRVAMSTTHLLTVVAGNFSKGFSGDGGAATSAQLSVPQGIALDGTGMLYIADSQNQVIRAVDASGTIATFAGSGAFGRDPAPVQAASAHFEYPTGLALDTVGNLYVTEQAAHDVRRISAGTVSVFAGTGIQGNSGDGGSATAATLDSPFGLAIDPAGDVYISDAASDVVRKVQASDGSIDTVAGNPAQAGGFTSGIAPAPSIGLNSPVGLAFDTQLNLYIVDSGNSTVREIPAVPGIMAFPSVSAGASSAPQSFKIANIGNAPLSLASVATADSVTANNFTLAGDTGAPCGTSIASGAHCQYSVTYTPAQNGAVSGELDVTYKSNNPNFNSVAPVYLKGGVTDVFAITPTTLSPLPIKTSASVAITTTGGTGLVTLDLEGTLPPGITSAVNNGILTLSGKPTQSGSYSFTVFAGDALGATAVQAYTLQVQSTVVTLNVVEALHVLDSPQTQLSLQLNLSESIHVTDLPTENPSRVLAVMETIHVSDVAKETPSTLLAVAETIHVTDTSTGNPSLTLAVNEIVHVADASSPVLSATLTVTETIRVLDADSNLPSTSSATSESIHVTDTVSLSVVLAPTLTESFSVSPVAPGASSTVTFTLGNPAANSVTLTGVGFTDTLPTGLSLIDSSQSTTCSGGSLSATGTSISLNNNATITPGATCKVTFKVSSSKSGSYTNMSGAVTAANAGIGGTATATLTVAPTRSITIISPTVRTGSMAYITAYFDYTGTVPPSGTVTMLVNGSSAQISGLTCVYKASHSNCTAAYSSVNVAPGSYTLTVSQAADNNYVAVSGIGFATVTP